MQFMQDKMGTYLELVLTTDLILGI